MTKLLSGDALTDRASQALSVPIARSIGLELLDADAPWNGVTFVVTEQSSNGAGSVHASMLAAAMESAAYLVLLPQLGVDEHAVTHSFSMNLSSAVAVGNRVSAIGSVDRRTRRLAFVSVTAEDEGVVAARAQLVKSIVPFTDQ